MEKSVHKKPKVLSFATCTEYCSEMRNDQQDAQFCHNQFYSTICLSALHVSNESSRPSTGGQNTVQYIILCSW